MSATLSELPCLTSVLEYLPLLEIASFSRVNKWWDFSASVCPFSVLDTVGVSIPTERLIGMILANRTNLHVLRVSVPETRLSRFVQALTRILPQLTRLESLAIFTESADGSVRCNSQALLDIERRHTPTTGTEYRITTLVLSCDPSVPAVRALIDTVAPGLTGIAFLRGCHDIFRSGDELSQFFELRLNMASIRCLYLGHCNSEIDMDPVIARLLADATQLEYIQWSGAGASIDMMKSLMQRKSLECAFEGAGVLSMLTGLL